MAAQDNLPEGTDHIINGAMETGTGSGGSAGGGGGAGGAHAASSGGFVASGSNDGTGGTASGGSGGASGLVETLRSQTESLRGQAGDRVREFADGGKSRASDTPRIAFAPSRDLLGVPSSSIMVRSIWIWFSASMPPIASNSSPLTASTARSTPLPR